MGLRFLPNDALRNSNQLQAELSGAPIDNQEILNLATGPLHLDWKGSGSARDIQYINQTDLIEFDTCVVERADRLLTHSLALFTALTYGGARTSLFTTTDFNEPLVGPDGYSFVHDFGQVESGHVVGAATGAGTGGAFFSRINKLFFSKSIRFTNIESVSRRPLARFTHARIEKTYFDVVENINISIYCATDEHLKLMNDVCRLEQAPFYLYDDEPDLLARRIPEVLIYCLLVGYQVDKIGHELNRVTFTLHQLRSYSNP